MGWEDAFEQEMRHQREAQMEREKEDAMHAARVAMLGMAFVAALAWVVVPLWGNG